MNKPPVCILRTDGTNCDEELFYSFEKFGAAPEYVHVNQIREKDKRLKNYKVLGLPGGFAYGDDVASGKILAVELISFLKDEIQNYLRSGGLILGVCNGFQALVRTGLLPFNHLGKMDATLAQNKSGHFECRWVKIKSEKSPCEFLSGEEIVMDIAVNHGEGNFYSSKELIEKVENQNLVTFRYVDEKNNPTMDYPKNPNGSTNAIAGVCDPTGRILGIMPHPEKFVDITQHPNWRRNPKMQPLGGFIFERMIKYVKNN